MSDSKIIAGLAHRILGEMARPPAYLSDSPNPHASGAVCPKAPSSSLPQLCFPIHGLPLSPCIPCLSPCPSRIQSAYRLQASLSHLPPQVPPPTTPLPNRSLSSLCQGHCYPEPLLARLKSISLAFHQAALSGEGQGHLRPWWCLEQARGNRKAFLVSRQPTSRECL